MEININIRFDGHGLRWHACKAIAKGAQADLKERGSYIPELDTLIGMVDSLPPKKFIKAYARLVWLHPAQRLLYHGHTSKHLPGKKVL